MPVVTLSNPVMFGSQSLAAGVSVDVSEEQAQAWGEAGYLAPSAAEAAAAAEAQAKADAEAAAAEAAAAQKSGKKKADA